MTYSTATTTYRSEFPVIDYDGASYDGPDPDPNPAPTTDLIDHFGWDAVVDMGHSYGSGIDSGVYYESLCWSVAEALADFTIGGASWRAEA